MFHIFWLIVERIGQFVVCGKVSKSTATHGQLIVIQTMRGQESFFQENITRHMWPARLASTNIALKGLVVLARNLIKFGLQLDGGVVQGAGYLDTGGAFLASITANLPCDAIQNAVCVTVACQIEFDYLITRNQALQAWSQNSRCGGILIQSRNQNLY